MGRYQKGKTNLDFTEARDSEWQWHQLGHTQVCTLLQTDNHASTSPLSFFTGRMPFLPPNQQCQSTEGTDEVNQTEHQTTGLVTSLCSPSNVALTAVARLQLSTEQQLIVSPAHPAHSSKPAAMECGRLLKQTDGCRIIYHHIDPALHTVPKSIM